MLRSLSLLRPPLPTLPLLLLPPLWPLLVTELALVPLVATPLELLVLVLSATVLATVLVSLAFTKHSANVLFLLLSMICYLMNKDYKETYLTLHIVY